jgi:2-polyprenyl-3-methyl-5-hydroxy-6-metoxy-1,4-benzoquinol methylase
MTIHIADTIPERFVPETMQHELLAAEHLARYEWVAALAPGRRVLDAGCGTGYGSEILAAAGARHVLGADLAGAVVEAARARETEALEFEQADIARLPHPDHSFELITCFETIEHVPDPGAALVELARVLAPGGVLALSSPNADRSPGGNPHHVREFATEELRALLHESFANVRLLAQHQWVSSAVFEEGQLGPPPLEVRTVKAIGRRLGSETYTVALASTGALPELPAAAALTGTLELRRWVEHFDGQRRLLDEQAGYLAELEELDAERREARLQLADAETELATVRAELERTAAELAETRADADARLARADARVDGMQAELDAAEALMGGVWDSLSWRATRPLRGMKGLARLRRSG